MEMSKELDLGIDSFVFWDDNPIERSKVQNCAARCFNSWGATASY